jgi:hypothetical protein
MWHYAKGETMAKKGEFNAALSEADAAEALADHPVMKDLNANG